MSDPTISILGIRHHGPGSARAVGRALDELKPDCVVIEGPPDADELIQYVSREEMKPPVAILIHNVDNPADATYFPFAPFSPEWVAIRWALARNVPVRFMDLPQAHRMALGAERLKALLATVARPQEPEAEATAPVQQAAIALDPLQRLAEAAGFDDGETWWEHVVESRADHGTEIFAEIREAMAELRAAHQRDLDLDEPLREAWMRRTLREARKEGFARIAAICGAWHAPALDIDALPKKHDDELLKGLPRVKTSATWVPWTYDRLTFASGYGAGVRSPGWYDHLWHSSGAVLESWMTRVARLLREKDIDCSSAHVIEAVRLARTLAALRARPLADLSDIADATRAIFCFDSDLALRLIERELLVGIRMGELPDDIPMIALQQDLIRQQKRLRLKPEAQDKPLDLDLRNDTDRARSVLLHRLRLLDVDWALPRSDAASGKGTFRESWLLHWEPGFTIKLIDAGMFGNTVEQAAQAKLAQLAVQSSDLNALSNLLQDAMLADLGGAAETLVRRLEAVAAVSADISLLMSTLPALSRLMRYGNVRQTDETLVRGIIDGMIPRIIIGLGGAVASLNDEAATLLETHINATDQALTLIDSAEHLADWRATLARVLDQPAVHGLIRGRAARLLVDASWLERDAISRHLAQTLSPGNDPAQGARWLEGFLHGSGLLLIHDPKLLALIDDWVTSIASDIFEALLPLLRRTFTTFPTGERRQIGELLRKPSGARDAAAGGAPRDFNRERAARVLPLIMELLGGSK